MKLNQEKPRGPKHSLTTSKPNGQSRTNIMKAFIAEARQDLGK